jgi:hypothetical protein
MGHVPATLARRGRAVAGVAAVALAVVLAGCGGGSGPSRRALIRYVQGVEPIRLGVNRLLDGADPILAGYRGHRLSPVEAGRRFDRLERRFAGYTTRIAALEPANRVLGRLHRPYAHTYVLEDAYLSALAAALPSGDFDHLPDTQAVQRAAIIEWRTDLTVLASRLGVRLPADLQQAGRGEIAPSPGRS